MCTRMRCVTNVRLSNANYKHAQRLGGVLISVERKREEREGGLVHVCVELMMRQEPYVKAFHSKLRDAILTSG